MPRFKTTFNGYAAKFSPFVENRLAVATAQNFGIIGNGRLHVLEVRSPGTMGHTQLHRQTHARPFFHSCLLYPSAVAPCHVFLACCS